MAIRVERRGGRFFRHVAEKSPFSISEFDFALMVTPICFVDGIFKSFRGAFRVRGPRGRLIVGFVDQGRESGNE
ncbi:MAG: hypothetical protein R6U43_02455 [Candidatus Krumholzibacteriales bacterium]